jgi:abortive infection bacteriophage resistance protein
MLIHDEAQAREALLRINYYRFSGYALHFEVHINGQRTHTFKEGTTFDAVINLYEFDTRLRALLFSYIEPVEVAFRTALCYELSIQTEDPYWYRDRNRYDKNFNFNGLISTCKREYERSEETFIKSHKDKYGSSSLPPGWILTEILSMGQWSKIYKNLLDPEAKKDVARHFDTKPHFLESWIHALSVLRNLCAHHCRIWDRNFAIKPKLPTSLKASVLNNARIAALTLVLTHLLKPLEKNLKFHGDLDAMLAAFPEVPRSNMGFPQEEPL